MSEEKNPTRPRFQLAGTATIKHLNVRKEGPDDDKNLAVDIKLEVQKVDRALCEYFDDALAAFLWRGDTNALIARNVFLQPVQYLNQVETAQIIIGPCSFFGDVKKFSLLANDGGVMTVGCSVSVEPNSSEVATLANMVQDETQVRIIGPAGLFDGEGGDV
jgi:hypothetical protein